MVTLAKAAANSHHTAVTCCCLDFVHEEALRRFATSSRQVLQPARCSSTHSLSSASNAPSTYETSVVSEPGWSEVNSKRSDSAVRARSSCSSSMDIQAQPFKTSDRSLLWLRPLVTATSYGAPAAPAPTYAD